MNPADEINAKLALQNAHAQLMTLAETVRPGRERGLVDHISRNVSLAITALRHAAPPPEIRNPCVGDILHKITCPECRSSFQSKARIKTICKDCRVILKYEKGRWKVIGGRKKKR